eukprot:NODE_119_length_18186_cov_1.929397.p11 type:complete len:208 gc:universal NODE_119_length_18186_cov_1.929397:15257-15880(+)
MKVILMLGYFIIGCISITYACTILSMYFKSPTTYPINIKLGFLSLFSGIFHLSTSLTGYLYYKHKLEYLRTISVYSTFTALCIGIIGLFYDDLLYRLLMGCQLLISIAIGMYFIIHKTNSLVNGSIVTDNMQESHLDANKQPLSAKSMKIDTKLNNVMNDIADFIKVEQIFEKSPVKSPLKSPSSATNTNKGELRRSMRIKNQSFTQ